MEQMRQAREAGATWWACSEPERPTDHGTLWHPAARCAACRMKAEAVAWQNLADGETSAGIALYLGRE